MYSGRCSRDSGTVAGAVETVVQWPVPWCQWCVQWPVPWCQWCVQWPYSGEQWEQWHPDPYHGAPVPHARTRTPIPPGTHTTTPYPPLYLVYPRRCTLATSARARMSVFEKKVPTGCCKNHRLGVFRALVLHAGLTVCGLSGGLLASLVGKLASVVVYWPRWWVN